MNRKYVQRALGAAALLILSSQAGAANLLTNGSFESPDIATPTYLNSGSTFMTGWTVGVLPGSAPGTQVQLTDNSNFGSLGVVGSQGSQFLDLTGNVGRGGGVISNGFATVAGASYTVAFDIGAFWVRGPGSFGNVTVDLLVDNVLASSFTNLLSLNGPGSDWERKSWTFTGTGNAMTIGLFSSLSTASSNLGVGLDNVVLEQVGAPPPPPPPPPVPEPASWAMMIAGFALVGSALRGRSARVATA